MNPLLKFLLLSTSSIPRDVEGAGMGGSPAGDSGAPPVDTGTSGNTPADDTGGTDNTTQTDPEPSLEEQLDSIWDEAHGVKDRDERGRFKSRNADTLEGADGDHEGDEFSDDEGDLGDGDPNDDQPGEEGEDQTSQDATDDMPNSWSKDKAEVWKSLTPEARDYVRQRETEAQQALSRAGRAVNIVKNAQPVLEAIAPFNKYLHQVGQAVGKAPAQLVHDVLRFENTLRTAPDNETKLNVIKDIVAEYGVDVSSLIGADASEAIRQNAAQDIERHPVVVQMRRQIQQLSQMTIGERQQQMQAQVEEIDTAIQTAAADTQTFPYFNKVRAEMAALIGAMPDDPNMPVGEMVKRAYEAACRANPEIFQSIQRDQQRKMTEEQRRLQQQRAQRARQASAPNVRTTTPSPSKLTMEQDLERTASKYYK